MLYIEFQNSRLVFGSLIGKNMPGHWNEKKCYFGVMILEEVMYYNIMDPSLQNEAQISEPLCVSVKRFSSLRRRDEPIHIANGTVLPYGGSMRHLYSTLRNRVDITQETCPSILRGSTFPGINFFLDFVYYSWYELYAIQIFFFISSSVGTHTKH
jgi:hypothetical protein